MALFKKTPETSNEGSSNKRVKGLETPALYTWFDSSLMGLGYTFDQWRFHGGSPEEIGEYIDALSELWKELQARTV